MPVAFAPEGLVLFAHVPKTAGTSLEAYLEERFGPLALNDLHWKNTGLSRRSLVVSPQHITGDDLDRLLPPETRLWCFAVIRDPVARMLSEYGYQFERHNIRSRWRRIFARFGFSVWLAMALAIARRRPVFLDGHLRPQVDFLPEGCEIFRLEDGLEAVIARLDEICGGGAPHLSVGRRMKSRLKRPVRPSAGDLRLIRRAFAEDYARFGYPLPDPAAAPSSPLDPLRHLLGRLLAPLAARLYFIGRM